MRTMKDVKYQMQQLLVTIETPVPRHHHHSMPSSPKIPGANIPGPGALAVQGEHLWALPFPIAVGVSPAHLAKRGRGPESGRISVQSLSSWV